MSVFSDVRWAGLVCALVAFAGFVAAHAFLCRFWLAHDSSRSPQKATAALALAVNLPAVIVPMLVMSVHGLGWIDRATGAVYAVLVYNSLAYAYFHFFNLSETGRRIRMLLQLLDGQQPDLGAAGAYGGQAMIAQRLVRLQQMGQITLSGDRYTLRSQFLWRIGRWIHALGVVAARPQTQRKP